MSILRNGMRRLACASAAVTRQQGVGAAAATRSFVAVAQAAGRIPAHQTFAALTVGGSSSSSSAFASSPHFQQRRGVVVNPDDADAWEKFILGLPANLKEDIRFRKKLFFEADKDHDGKLTKEELAAFLHDIQLDAVAVNNLLQIADVTHDGKLCLEEFSTMIQAYIENPRFDVD